MAEDISTHKQRRTANEAQVSPADLLRRLTYFPETGVMIWRSTGRVAGSPERDGRLRLGWQGKRFVVARVAWAMSYRSWPGGDVDHINGDCTDDRLANLRVVDQQANTQNQHRAQRSSSHGFRGAAFNRGRWQASIRVNGKTRYLGRFDTGPEAEAAYLSAKAELHPGWSGQACTNLAVWAVGALAPSTARYLTRTPKETPHEP